MLAGGGVVELGVRRWSFSLLGGAAMVAKSGDVMSGKFGVRREVSVGYDDSGEQFLCLEGLR